MTIIAMVSCDDSFCYFNPDFGIKTFNFINRKNICFWLNFNEMRGDIEDVKRISKIIIDEMASVANSDQHSFSIPLTVDLNTGDNWGALH